jgi:hypothetical protein
MEPWRRLLVEYWTECVLWPMAIGAPFMLVATLMAVRAAVGQNPRAIWAGLKPRHLLRCARPGGAEAPPLHVSACGLAIRCSGGTL